MQRCKKKTLTVGSCRQAAGEQIKGGGEGSGNPYTVEELELATKIFHMTTG